MNPSILFIGSIGVVAETSEIQRQAYNKAMAEKGVTWEWSKEVYKELLKSSGGKSRLHLLSAATDNKLSDALIDEIHTEKTRIAGESIKKQSVKPRPGLINLIKEAKETGAKVAWVTTTGTENTGAILEALDGQLSKDDFDHIFHRHEAEKGKPYPDIYLTALEKFDVSPNSCIAIEDSLNSVLSAKGADIFTVATLGDYHNEHVYNIADLVIPSLEKVSWSDLTEKTKN